MTASLPWHGPTLPECRACSVADARARFVEDIERGGTDHDAALAVLEQHFDERTGGLVFRRD